MIKNTYYILSLLSIICYSHFSLGKEEIRLTSPALALIDGVKGLMDEHKVHKIIWMGHKVFELQNGELDGTAKKRKPQHEFEGRLYTLKELVKLEHDHEIKFKDIKMLHPTQYDKITEPFTKILTKIKSQFEQLTTPFIKESYGAEEYMNDLIAESCRKRNKPNSLLIGWSEAILKIRKEKIWHEGIEHEFFRKHVTSLQKLDAYCSDLINFSKDLIRSCPKALKRYQEWQKLNKPNK